MHNCGACTGCKFGPGRNLQVDSDVFEGVCGASDRAMIGPIDICHTRLIADQDSQRERLIVRRPSSGNCCRIIASASNSWLICIFATAIFPISSRVAHKRRRGGAPAADDAGVTVITARLAAAHAIGIELAVAAPPEVGHRTAPIQDRRIAADDAGGGTERVS